MPKKLPPGIKSLEWLDPKTLTPHPLNWKKHPQRQRQAFNALKAEAGWAGAALYNRTTGRLIDGHARAEEASKKGELLPVLVGDWTEEQELLLLANLDPMGLLAETNHAALASLSKTNSRSLESLSSANKKALTTLAKAATSLGKTNDAADVPRSGNAGVTRVSTTEDIFDPSSGGIQDVSFKEDVIFPGVRDNPWGIPALRSDRLCTVIPRTTWNKTDASISPESWYCYSAGPNTFPPSSSRHGGILGFFTEDFRFERAWNDSGNFTKWLLDSDWGGVVLPDYSTWDSWPFAVRLHNLYRSRWCGRYWQEAGLPIIPILQSIGDTPATGATGTGEAVDVGLEEIVLGTLPSDIPVAAIQCRTSEKKDTDYWEGVGDFLTICLDQLRISTVVVYGGDEHQKHLSGHLPRYNKKRPTEFVWLPSYISKRRTTFSRKTN